MIDSYDSHSFREDWQPVGKSREATLRFQRHMQDYVLAYDQLYYFKPIETFLVPGLAPERKFEEIDSYILAEFHCEADDIHTITSDRFGQLIVMPEQVLLKAGVKLPLWREPSSRRPGRSRLALVPREFA